MGRGIRHRAGGIASLAEIIDGHGGALDYDLITRAHLTLSDFPDRVGWDALYHFVRYLPADSALVSEMKPDIAGWQNGTRMPIIVADLYDLVSMWRYEWECSVTPKNRRKPKKPKPYPRPGADPHAGERHFGKDPIPVSDFDAWWKGGEDG